MPPKLGARALAKKAANSKAAEKAKKKFEAEEAKAKAKAKAKAQAEAVASGLIFDFDLPPAYGRIYCVPRDAPRVLQIEVVEEEKEPIIKYAGPDYGPRAGKYITAIPAISSDNLFCIPYSAPRVLEIEPKEGVIHSIGDTLPRGFGRYTDACASQDYRLKLYAAPCRARKVLEIDPVSKKCHEVGPELGDPNEVKTIVVRGLTKKSRKANGIYEKAEDKYDNYPFFERKYDLPKEDTELPPGVMAEESSDDDFGNEDALKFFVYMHKKRRWCLSPALGTPWEDAWCWMKGKETAPPSGMWTVNEKPPPPPPENEDGEDGVADEEEEEEENLGPVKEKAMMCSGYPSVEVNHPPKWWGVAYHPNRNRIFAAPYNARKVLMINPTKGGEATEVGPDLGPMPAKYSTLVLAPNGCLFAAPLNAPRVLMISDEGLVQLVGPDLGRDERKYSCMILANNKLLYAPPLYAERVLEINCAKGNTRQIGPILGMGEAKYACAALGKNGYIYCAPLEARRMIEIRPEDHEVEEFGMDLGGVEHEKYSSIMACAVGNKLYAAPREAHKVIEIDPERGFVREVGPELGRIPRKFTCMIAGPKVQPPKLVPPLEEPQLSEEQPPPGEQPPLHEPGQKLAEPTKQEALPQPAHPQQPQPPARARPQELPQQPQPARQENPWQRKPQLY
mmetsp:Transcript_125058/g.312552  ORF Transcript_125058/g.312552 Transcript_125058/m.312552 type:complete len:676 (+) Transcript_125058:73-2100(+)